MGKTFKQYPDARSMYGIFTYMWLKYMVNVGECSIRGAYRIHKSTLSSGFNPIEKYACQIGSFLHVEVKIIHI